MNNNIQTGLEYELQLMVETDKGLKVVSAEQYLNRQYNLLPQCTIFDFGNIEISTPPRESYKEAVEIANYILTDKLVPALINSFKLEKFALFLPTPMCAFYYNDTTRNGRRTFAGSKIQIIRPTEKISCLKHWNISINVDRSMYEREDTLILLKDPRQFDFLTNFMKESWPYNYEALISKGYQVMVKDLEIPYSGRVHIKIPYHYSPINGNPNLLPNFEDTLLPPERGWRSLVCYYKDYIFTKVRDLI